MSQRRELLSSPAKALMNPTPVETLAVAGITEENKHDILTLGTILSQFTFKYPNDRLRITKGMVDQIHAISMLLIEAAGRSSSVASEETTVGSSSSTRPSKKRKLAHEFVFSYIVSFYCLYKSTFNLSGKRMTSLRLSESTMKMISSLQNHIIPRTTFSTSNSPSPWTP